MAYSTDDTIVAVATPAGRGGLGIVRLSGGDAPRIAAEMTSRRLAWEPRRATFARFGAVERGGAEDARLASAAGLAADQVVVTLFAAPASYTGEDVVEISAHGSPVVIDALVRAALGKGARLAAPGEFTLRAFLHGRLDLVQAEAVRDLIEAVTPLQARTAFEQLDGRLTETIGAIERRLFDIVASLEASLDFPDAGYHFQTPGETKGQLERLRAQLEELAAESSRGRLVREGARVVIAGAPNVGKSSLFNALVNADRAIVTGRAGTTRDLLREEIDLHGLALELVDTAGLRESADEVERAGVARARGALGACDLVLIVLDRSRAIGDEDRAALAETAERPRVVVANKRDLPSGWGANGEEGSRVPALDVSASTGEGLADLRAAIVRGLGGGEPLRDAPRISNVRHAALVERAVAAIVRAREAIAAGRSEEFVLADLQDAAAALQETTGRRSSEDLLRRIFERFCVGK